MPHLACLNRHVGRQVFRRGDIPSVVTRVLGSRNVRHSTFRFRLNDSCTSHRCYIRCTRDSLTFVRHLYTRINVRFRFRRDPGNRLLIFNSSRATFPHLPRSALCLPNDNVTTDRPTVGHFDIQIRAQAATMAHHSCGFGGPNIRLRDHLSGRRLPILRSCRFPNRFASHSCNGGLAREALRHRNTSFHRTRNDDSRSTLIYKRFLRLTRRPHRT